jgi:SSS family solute:Na+ symporter
VVALAIAGLAIAYRPPATFLEIATETFTGLAVLFPTAVGAIYWRRMNPRAAIASILVGESLVGAYHFKSLPTFGTLPVVPVIVVTTLVLVVGTLLFPIRVPRPQDTVKDRLMSRRAVVGWLLVFAVLFASGNDFWAWNDGRLGWFGFPWWVWYYAALCAVLAAAFALFGRWRIAGENLRSVSHETSTTD